MKLLHIDSSVTGAASVSRVLTAEIVARFAAHTPSLEVTRRDLTEDPLPHFLVGAEDPAVVAHNETILAEYIDADVVVVGVPLYNFGLSSTLKAWIDRVVIAGRTFRYGPDGRPMGLVPNKRIVMAIARGSVYAKGSPFEAFEHAEAHLRTIFAFLGIHDCEAVVAEGLAISQEHRERGLAEAREAVASLSLGR